MPPKESEAHPDYIDALLAATAEDTVLTEAFSVGWPDAPHRVLRAWVEAAQAFQGDVVAEQLLGDQRMPVPRLAARIPTRNTTGTISAMSLAAGESVGAVLRVQPAGEIVRELAEEAETAIAELERRHTRDGLFNPGLSP